MRATPISVLPPLQEGEALRSYFERARVLNAATIKSLSGERPRARWRTPDWCLPTGIAEFARVYGQPLGRSDATYWVARHTLSPYFESTLESKRRTSLVERLLEPMRGPRRPLLPIALSEWFAKLPVLCRVCDEESVDLWGFSHVQRHWLLPFMTRCHVHGEPLTEHPDWSPVSRGRSLELPKVASRQGAGVGLAQQSLALLHESLPRLEVLGHMMQSKGFTTRTGRVRRQAVAELVYSYGKHRYEDPELSALMDKQSSVDKLLKPLWSPRACMHPAVAQILIDALSELPQREQLGLWPSQREVKRAALDAALASGASPTKAAREAGVCVTVAVVHMRAAGLAVQARPKKLKPPVRGRLLEMLAAGEDLAKAARKVNVSTVTVYRVLASNPAVRETRKARLRVLKTQRHKAEWLRLLEVNPEAGIKFLRAQAPALYAYLYRNARKWLQCQAPRTAIRGASAATSARAPAGADFALASRLRHAAKLDGMEMPARATKSALLKAAGRANQATIPGLASAKLLQARAESLQQFVYRRLSAATAHLHNEGIELAIWRVERESGLRPAVIARSGVRTEIVIADTKAAALKRLNL